MCHITSYFLLCDIVLACKVHTTLSPVNQLSYIDVECIIVPKLHLSRSQWPARTLGSWARIPLKALMCVCVYSVFVLFYV
jgi:hypothetical protein